MSNPHNFVNFNFNGKQGDPDLTTGERTFTNLDDDLFNEGKEGMFLEKDIRDIDMFGTQNTQFDIDNNFLDYLRADASRISEHKPSDKPRVDGVMDSVKEMYTQLNYMLEKNALPIMGDFWNVDAMEIQKTLNVISYLCKRRGEDMSSRISVVEDQNNLRAQIKTLSKSIEDLQKDKLQLKKDKKALLSQVEMKDKEASQAIRERAGAEITIKKDTSKYEKKIQMYQHELKNKETEMFRIKKQMTKILDEKTTFSNSYIEIKKSADMKRIAKICDQYRSKGDLEFVEMLKNGFDSTYNVLVDENTQLKGCLLSLQSEMKDLIDAKTRLICESKSKSKDEILKEVNMKLYRLKVIQPKAFKLSLVDSINDIQTIFKENLDRISKFIDAFINPQKLFEFLDRLNEDSRMRKSVGKIRSLDELYELIVGLKITQPLADFTTSKKAKFKGKDERITAKWNTEFGEGVDEGIYTKSTKPKSYQGDDAVSDQGTNLKKQKVQAERKKWENLISAEKSNTFFFDSEGSDDKK